MRFFKSKFFMVLCAVILFIGGFSLYSVTLTDGTASGNIGKAVSVFFKNGLNAVGNFFADGIDGLFNYGNVVRENESLRSSLAAAEKELAEFGGLEEENIRLKELLGIVGDGEMSFELTECRAVSKADGDWFSVFTVNKGSGAGISVGDAVLTADGLAGLVSDVGLNWAVVTSIIDKDSSLGGLVIRTGDAAVLKGDYDLMDKGLCRLDYISDTAVISRGDIVYSSGLGGVVPYGLRIGRITEINSDEQGVSVYAVVTPSVDFSRISRVYVITDVNTENSSAPTGSVADS